MLTGTEATIFSAVGEFAYEGRIMKLTTLLFAAAFGAGLALVSPSADAMNTQDGNAVPQAQSGQTR